MVNWRQSATKPTETLDALLTENWHVVAASYAGLFDRSVLSLEAAK
jgi:hypothetical protein